MTIALRCSLTSIQTRPCRRRPALDLLCPLPDGTRRSHRSASAVDLIIAATAAHDGLTVLRDDADYRNVARHAADLTEHNIHDIP